MPDFFLALAALTTVFAAFGVIVSREAVHSALFLTLHLLGVGTLFLALTNQFLAVAQLLVYAGAVMVVFMFAVTTLSPHEEPLKVLPGDWRIPSQWKSLGGILAGLGVFAALWMSISRSGVNDLVAPAGTELIPVQTFALDLFGPFLLPFEGTAFLLLVALIGAVILGGRRQLGDG